MFDQHRKNNPASLNRAHIISTRSHFHYSSLHKSVPSACADEAIHGLQSLRLLPRQNPRRNYMRLPALNGTSCRGGVLPSMHFVRLASQWGQFSPFDMMLIRSHSSQVVLNSTVLQCEWMALFCSSCVETSWPWMSIMLLNISKVFETCQTIRN